MTMFGGPGGGRYNRAMREGRTVMRPPSRRRGGGPGRGARSAPVILFLAVLGAVFLLDGQDVLGILVILAGISYLFFRFGRPIWGPLLENMRSEQDQRQLDALKAASSQVLTSRADDALAAVRQENMRRGGGAFVGISPDRREWIAAVHESAVLILGPPRSGKTSALIVPSILCATGPVVSTSTKLDVLNATYRTRTRSGTVWLFDPAGTESEMAPLGVSELRWSPVTSSIKWDKARAMASAMVGGSSVGVGVENASYWTESAKALLAPMLHAAALSGQGIADVRRWILNSNFEEPGVILTNSTAELAADELARISQTEARERSSIVSTTANVLAAYGSEAAMAKCVNPNFRATDFVQSMDTIYITAPSATQDMVAPLIVGLLDEVRDATFALARRSTSQSDFRNRPVVWALDEIANIAPIKTLPGLVSEGGGQGLHIIACFQDLSQASVRWGAAADGFLSLFGTKVVFPGIGDKKTLDALSTLLGDWDRPYTVYTQGRSYSFGHTTKEVSTQESVRKEAQLSPGDIANIPVGNALTIRAGRWGLVECTPYFSAEPWRTVITQSTAAPPVTG